MRRTGELFTVFGRIGLLSFGGPAAQIALMHKELVEDRNWLTESQFLRALSFCMLLPGPEAMQLATYAGWRRQGNIGGLIAGCLFFVPGAIVILGLALAYGAYADLSVVQAAFAGIKATVVVIVINALRKVASKALKTNASYGIAVFSFVALFVLDLPYPLVIFLAALAGIWLPKVETIAVSEPAPYHPTHFFKVLGIGSLLWAAPVVVAWLLGASFLVDVGLYFSKLAVVTFGGAYAVLAYMTQTVVGDFGWLTTGEMIDALGLAETTPGPLILVTQFVAMLAGLSQGGIGTALLAGLLTLWVTFVPCFIWIFAGAPLIDWLEGQAKLQAALSGITAAVVGVIANLSLWFAMHVFFQNVVQAEVGPLRISSPDFVTVQWAVVALALLAGALILWRGFGIVSTLAITAGTALILSLVGML
ncbi:chromate transporter [Cognatiyoonia koreensis]|uniref:Chromate transporter n=1 Tax=Cognatiyoonia koreensis TaxID=364200 RepID=A0A1I0PD82_9RHOB|nr:chromate efflux transporter [Cognatiyoonia koreensis]SEW12107.1 chromate transporter [Cognatiyoonia koreensis]